MEIGPAFYERLQQKFPQSVCGSNFTNLDPWIEVTPEGLTELALYLRDTPDLQFKMLNCISGVDYFQPDTKKAAKFPWQPHLELVYHLYSFSQKTSLTLKVSLPRWKHGLEGQLPEIASVAHIWRTADWHEREVYDLMGVHFIGHPNLRRILCPEDWEGHPLRRDYQQPLEYQGIRGR